MIDLEKSPPCYQESFQLGLFYYNSSRSCIRYILKHFFLFTDAVTRSAVFFAAAAFLLCSGYCCSVIGQCARHKGLYTFISGIVFIVTGMCYAATILHSASALCAELENSSGTAACPVAVYVFKMCILSSGFKVVLLRIVPNVYGAMGGSFVDLCGLLT